MSCVSPFVITVLVTVTNISTLPRSVPGTSPGMTIECVAIRRFWVLADDYQGPACWASVTS
jgi:hypothetical protein